MKRWPDVLGCLRDYLGVLRMWRRLTGLPPYSYSYPPVYMDTRRIPTPLHAGTHHPYTAHHDPENRSTYLQVKDGHITKLIDGNGETVWEEGANTIYFTGDLLDVDINRFSSSEKF